MKMSDINDDLLLDDVDDQDLNEDELLLSDEDEDALKIKSHLALDEDDLLLDEPKTTADVANQPDGEEATSTKAPSPVPKQIVNKSKDIIKTQPVASQVKIQKVKSSCEKSPDDAATEARSKPAVAAAVTRRSSRPVLKRNNVSNPKIEEVSSTNAVEAKNVKETNKLELSSTNEVVPEKIARTSSPKPLPTEPIDVHQKPEELPSPVVKVTPTAEATTTKAPDLNNVTPIDKKHASDEDEPEERFNPKQVVERDNAGASPDKNPTTNAPRLPHSSPRHFKGNPNQHFSGPRGGNHQFPTGYNNSGPQPHQFSHNVGQHSGNENFNPQPSQYGPQMHGPNFRPQRPPHHQSPIQPSYGGDYRMPMQQMRPQGPPQRPPMPPNGEFQPFHGGGNRPDFNNPNQLPFRPLAGPNGPPQTPGGMPQRFGGMRPHGPTPYMQQQRPQISGGGAPPMGQFQQSGGAPNRHPSNFHMPMPQNSSGGPPIGTAILPRKVLINPNFKGGVEAATSQLMSTLQNGQFMQSGPSDAELLRQQEAFINQNRRHIEKRRHERSPQRERSRERSYTPPSRSRRPHSRERRGREFYRARRGDSREDTRSLSKKRRSSSFDRDARTTKKDVEEDEETRKYRLMIEQQKEKREKVLRDKEMRRRLAAEKKTEDEDKRIDTPANKLTPIQVKPGKIISLKKKDSSSAPSATKEQTSHQQQQQQQTAPTLQQQRQLPITKILLEAKKENASGTLAVVKPLNKSAPQARKQPRTVYTTTNMMRQDQRPYSADEDEDDESLASDSPPGGAVQHNDPASEVDDDDDDDDTEEILLEELHPEAATYSKNRRIVLKPTSDLPAQQLLRRQATSGDTTDDRSKGVFDRLERKILTEAAKRKIQRIVINNAE